MKFMLFPSNYTKTYINKTSKNCFYRGYSKKSKGKVFKGKLIDWSIK